jgi:hypothetical protein
MWKSPTFSANLTRRFTLPVLTYLIIMSWLILQLHCLVLVLSLAFFTLTVGYFPPSVQSHQLRGYKAFSTRASHLSVVSLFYCTLLGVYLSFAVSQNSHSSATAWVMYTVVTPMLNPFIYSLRNKDIKRAMRRPIKKYCIKAPIFPGLK